jgi:DNA invertase Pin-like site-specific DNA recombinase
MVAHLEAGDILMVTRLDQLARSTREIFLARLMLRRNGVSFWLA